MHGPVLRACGLGGIVSYVDGQSTTFVTEGPFSPDTAHDEFGRQTSKCLFVMPGEDEPEQVCMSGEPRTPTRSCEDDGKHEADDHDSDEDIGVVL